MAQDVEYRVVGRSSSRGLSPLAFAHPPLASRAEAEERAEALRHFNADTGVRIVAQGRTKFGLWKDLDCCTHKDETTEDR